MARDRLCHRVCRGGMCRGSGPLLYDVCWSFNSPKRKIAMRSQTACDRVSRALFPIGRPSKHILHDSSSRLREILSEASPQPKASGKPCRTGVDTALPLDELVERLGMGLFIAYRSTRDHFDLVRLSTFAGSAVQRMTAANGSSPSNGQILRNRSAQ
jgi:hypothetical protein